MVPLPFVKTSFSFVTHEESNKSHSSISLNSNSKTSSSTFISEFVEQKKSKSKGQVPQSKNSGLQDHNIEKCFKLIGFPNDFKLRSDSNNQNK